ncbi:MAG: CHAT domain-containing protein [Pseudomonadota bacterium]
MESIFKYVMTFFNHLIMHLQRSGVWPKLLSIKATVFFALPTILLTASSSVSADLTNVRNSVEPASYSDNLPSNFEAPRNVYSAGKGAAAKRDAAQEDRALQLAEGFNLAHLATCSDKLTRLDMLAKYLPAIVDDVARASFALSMGNEAGKCGAAGLKAAYDLLDLARTIATELQNDLLLAKSLNGLSQLYEQQDRFAEALRLTDEGVRYAQRIDEQDLLIALEWRRGRLFKQIGRTDLALDAYQRAVDHIEAIRQDIPITYQEGKSSFRETLEPVYLGLADLLLRASDGKGEAQQQVLYQRARDALELMKQSEMADFLGDRCTVDAAKHALTNTVPSRTAILYPIMLPDRLELLLETANGIQRRSTSVSDEDVRRTISRFTVALRKPGSSYRDDARQLFDWLLYPFDDILKNAQIDTIVFVPDGKLRLIPLGALHDGNQFIAQKYAVATIPGLTMTSSNQRIPRNQKILLAGLSEVGPVWEKLPPTFLEEMGLGDIVVESTVSRGPRSLLRGLAGLESQSQDKPTQEYSIKEMLLLPGVEKEISTLRNQFKGEVLLNEKFTLDRFKARVVDGDYNIVHIASHGYFSNRAQTSFIMTYDDLLTLQGLQNLLQVKESRDQSIDLLTLSACETAAGDDRAPLGFAGIALKAKAHSALGTLWPVADIAATTLMPRFYQALSQANTSKIKALQQAQMSLIADPAFEHPFFWAPFILVGNWQ